MQECDLCGMAGECEVLVHMDLQHARMGGFDPFALGLFVRSGTLHLGPRTTIPVLESAGLMELPANALAIWDDYLSDDYGYWHVCPPCMTHLRPCLETALGKLGELGKSEESKLPLEQTTLEYFFDLRAPIAEAAATLERLAGMLRFKASTDWRQDELLFSSERDFVHERALAHYKKGLTDSSVDSDALFDRLLEPTRLLVLADRIRRGLSISCAECGMRFRVSNLNVLHRLVLHDVEVRAALQPVSADGWRNGNWLALPPSLLGYDDPDFVMKFLDPFDGEGAQLECSLDFERVVLSAGGESGRLDAITSCPRCQAPDVRIRIKRHADLYQVAEKDGCLPLVVSVLGGLAAIAAIIWLVPASVDYRVKIALGSAAALGAWWLKASWTRRANLALASNSGDYSYLTGSPSAAAGG